MSRISNFRISRLFRVAAVTAALAGGVALTGEAFAQRGPGPFGSGAPVAQPEQQNPFARRGGARAPAPVAVQPQAPAFRGGGQAFGGNRFVPQAQPAYQPPRQVFQQRQVYQPRPVYRPAPAPVYQPTYRPRVRIAPAYVPYPVYQPVPVYRSYAVYPGPRLVTRCTIQKKWVKTSRGYRKLPRKVCVRRWV